MTERNRTQYLEVDGSLFKVVETTDFYDAFALTDEGAFKRVPASRIIAVGSPITRTEFCEEAIERRLASGRFSKTTCNRMGFSPEESSGRTFNL